MTTEPHTLDEWVEFFASAQMPMLRHTIEDLAVARTNEDQLSARDLARIILHDPMLSLALLRHMQSVRRNTQPTEITTVSNAIIMLGIGPFFAAFSNLSAVETLLDGKHEALAGLRRVVSRAVHASAYARDWAVLRHDTSPDEIAIAALLHDMAEMLLWSFAPKAALQIRVLMLSDRTLRSAAAQAKVLGFPLNQLELQLGKRWHLPSLLQSLLDDEASGNQRVLNVKYAVMLARHSANGWNDAALPDDYKNIKRFLACTDDQLFERIRLVTLQTAREWKRYETPPAAAWWPMA